MKNIIGHKKIFLSIAALLVILSIASIAIFGFRPSIEFAGGTLWQIRFASAEVDRAALEGALREAGIAEGSIVTEVGEGSQFLIRSKELNEEEHVRVGTALTSTLGTFEELSFQTIGAAVGGETKTKAITAVIMVLVGISLYIAFAFRKVSYPVNSWKYGFITLITLFHDAAIPAGLFALLGYVLHVEVDVNFIVALLLVMGFSVHDTIVVFDRIRENLRLSQKGKTSFEDLVNTSVNQTMARSVNTSLTLVLVLIALYVLGAENLRYFILTILVGVVMGTYSSIFVASPLLTIWRKK